MNRGDGLVRRIKTRSDVDANSSAGNEENDNNSPDRDEELEDNDSKETRLTLMEEVLLLGLKDKEVGGCCNENFCIELIFIIATSMS